MFTVRRTTLASVSLLSAVVLAAATLAMPEVAGAARVSQTFASTGSLQELTVPAGICAVSIVATGGSGGDAETAVGGVGAKVSARVHVTPGDHLQVLAGGAGQAPAPLGVGGAGGDGGFGGGGGGGVVGGGGGGASVVFGTSGAAVVAGGGGGGIEFTGYVAPGGDAGLLGADGATGGTANGQFVAGTGGTAGGAGGTGGFGDFPRAITTSAGGGGGVSTGGASLFGGIGGDGLDGFGGGGGGSSTELESYPGEAASPAGTGAGGLGKTLPFVLGPSGDGGQGTVGGGAGASPQTANIVGGAGGGGGGAGFGGGGGGVFGGGGGGGHGGGGGGVGGGGGGSSWVAPGAWFVGSTPASRHGAGEVTIRWDSIGDQCTAVVPGSGIVTAPSVGTADLVVPVTLSTASSVPVTVSWSTISVPGAPADTVLGAQAPVGDYTPSSGTVTFAPGETASAVHIPVLHGSSSPSEYVIVSFTAPVNARMGGFYGLGFGIILPPA